MEPAHRRMEASGLRRSESLLRRTGGRAIEILGRDSSLLLVSLLLRGTAQEEASDARRGRARPRSQLSSGEEALEMPRPSRPAVPPGGLAVFAELPCQPVESLSRRAVASYDKAEASSGGRRFPSPMRRSRPVARRRPRPAALGPDAWRDGRDTPRNGFDAVVTVSGGHLAEQHGATSSTALSGDLVQRLVGLVRRRHGPHGHASSTNTDTHTHQQTPCESNRGLHFASALSFAHIFGGNMLTPSTFSGPTHNR